MAKRSKKSKGQNPMDMMGQLQTVGGGAIKIVMTGDQQCQGVEIDPALLEDADVEMLQDLILTAFNSALEDSRQLAADRLGPLAGGLPLL